MLDFDPKNGHILDQSSPLQVKMAPTHLLTCVTSHLVRLMPKVSINVVATAKIVTKEAKKGHIMAIFSPLQVKMAPHHLLTCVTSLLVRPMPKVSITVVATAKIVTKEAKNGHIMVIFSHKEKPYGPDTYLT